MNEIYKTVEAVVFDLDDTLIPNVKYYKEAKNKVVSILLKEFNEQQMQEKQISDIIEHFDLTNTKTYGLSRERFVLSTIEAYFDLAKKCDKIIDLDIIKQIHLAASSVFDKIDLLEHEQRRFFDTLSTLDIPVYLLTSGDKVVQSFKIFQSEVFLYVPKENIHIVDRKTPDTFKEILVGKDLEYCIMVGNSKKSDINPSIEAGMFAIYIEEDTWAYEDAILTKSNKLFSINNFESIESTFNKIHMKIEKMKSVKKQAVV